MLARDAEEEDGRLVSLGLGADRSGPAITGCSPRTLVGKSICVCGSFPTTESRTAVTLNGMALGDHLVSGSSAVLSFRLPPDFSPGPLNLRSLASAGYGESDTATSTVSCPCALEGPGWPLAKEVN